MEELFTKFMECIPNDHYKQTRAIEIFESLIIKVHTILDLGCGDCRHEAALSKHCERYIPCDIQNSPESKTDTNKNIVSYDGINLPFNDNSIDVIFMNQVIEHIQYPFKLFPEISRVLKFNGFLIGSVSQLEPFHSYSFFNYTPFGLYSVFADVGLYGIIFRPSIDAISLIHRSLNKFILKRNYHFEDVFWTLESPLNYHLNTFLTVKHQTVKQINYAKLLTAGQFSFAFRKTK